MFPISMFAILVLSATTATADVTEATLQIWPRAAIGSRNTTVETKLIMRCEYRANFIMFTIDYDSTNVRYKSIELGADAYQPHWEITSVYEGLPRNPDNTNKTLVVQINGSGNNGTMTGAGNQVADIRWTIGPDCMSTDLHFDRACSASRIGTYWGRLICDPEFIDGSVSTDCAVAVDARAWGAIKELYK